MTFIEINVTLAYQSTRNIPYLKYSKKNTKFNRQVCIISGVLGVYKYENDLILRQPCFIVGSWSLFIFCVSCSGVSSSILLYTITIPMMKYTMMNLSMNRSMRTVWLLHLHVPLHLTFPEPAVSVNTVVTADSGKDFFDSCFGLYTSGNSHSLSLS